MFRTGLSTYAKKLDEKLFASYAEAGISAMEISVDKTEYDSLDYKMLYSLSQKYGIELWSYHLPFVPFGKINLAYRETQKYTLEYFNELIKKASDIGINKFVVHPSGEPIKEEQRREQMECSKESLFSLAELASRENAVIAVEDLPRTCLGNNSDEILELISVNDKLRVCLDTNHLLNESLTEFIYKVKDKIITTHISDYDFIDERHWLPGEGKLDWGAVVKALEDVGYNGVWLYEIAFEAPDTITRDKVLTCKDFAENAKKIFENNL